MSHAFERFEGSEGLPTSAKGDLRTAYWRYIGIRDEQTTHASPPLSDLTVEDVQAVVAVRLKDDYAGYTVRRELNVLRALYRDAAKVWSVRGLPDPFKALDLPKPSPHRERRLQDGHGDEKGEEERLRAELAKWKTRPDIHLDLFKVRILGLFAQ